MDEWNSGGRDAPVRVVVVTALVLATVAAAVVLLRSGDSYSVEARFESAAQLVEGSAVQVSGRRVGVIDSIGLAPDRTAVVKLRIDDERVTPLPVGTRAVLRSGSLSGVANRYVDLHMPGGPVREFLPSGGRIGIRDTVTNVDLDQIFNTFDGPTRQGLRRVVRGLGTSYAGRGEQADEGWRYLNPSLVASQRLFARFGADSALLRRFVDANARLMSDLAESGDELSLVVDRLATATGAIGSRRRELADAIARMPRFMDRASNTLTDARAMVDELDPLVRDSDPVVRRLPAMLRDVRGMARRGRAPVRQISAAIEAKGRLNDLLDLSVATLPLRDVVARPVDIRGRERPGTFSATAHALREQTPHMAFLRPYSVELTSWFDDFGHSNVYDAQGHIGRVSLTQAAFALTGDALQPVPPELRGEVFKSVASLGQRARCPGALERPGDDGSNPWKPSPDSPCDPSQVPVGK